MAACVSGGIRADVAFPTTKPIRVCHNQAVAPLQGHGMRTLFIYPEFPKTFWSYEKILELVNRKVLLPPLGMVTVAALLPQQWEMKLVDRNVREVTEAEWDWAELVIISGMIVQKDDMAVQIANAKERGLPVAVGGPFASSCLLYTSPSPRDRTRSRMPSSA